MTVFTYSPPRDCVNSLGIPVDNLSLKEAVDRIVDMALARDGKARLVSTLNVDFLVNSLGCMFYRPRHPELLKVLRDSDMVTADGFPILWLSRIAGKRLQQRVTGSDMVPALARRAANEGLSLFLLGGGEGVAAAAADTLRDANPGLRIAGTASPFIHTAGPAMANFAAADEELLREINGSGAHILLVGLGNPKQELWFNRNRHKLKIPVAIGVGGTFEFITGTITRAPQWVQNMNLEWLFRITQDPARLWRRYAKGLFKLGMLTAPLAYYRAREALFYPGLGQAEAGPISWRAIWSSRDQSLAVLRLPRTVSRRYLENLVRSLHEEEGETAIRILDFSKVRHIEIAGQQEFFALARLLRSPNRHISILGMSRALQRRLAAGRVMDILGENLQGNALSALTRAPATETGAAPGCRSYVMGNTALILLSGVVDGEGLASLGFVECLQHTARDRVCILDFRNVSLLESSAIAELHPLITAQQASREGQILVSGAVANVRQMFRMSGLDQPVRFIDDHLLLETIAAEGGSGD